MKPGPGQLSFLKSTTIGSSNRPALNNLENVPGAGSYDPPSKVVEGPRVIRKGKQRVAGARLPSSPFSRLIEIYTFAAIPHR